MQGLIDRIEGIETRTFKGRVKAINGLLIEAEGPRAGLTLGASVFVGADENVRRCEVVGFRGETALMMAHGDLGGIRAGAPARIDPDGVVIRPHQGWLGRVINAFGVPLDGQGPLAEGSRAYPVKGKPPCAHQRDALGERLDLGVRALNTFTPMRIGQRLGVFAGSGVGKSVLMSMITRGTSADVVVIGLIGERGREAREFVDDVLGEAGRARAVVITETSDAPALSRR